MHRGETIKCVLVTRRSIKECCQRCERAGWCTAFIAARRGLATVLETAKAEGRLLLRPIHGDPKVNNVMLCAQLEKIIRDKILVPQQETISYNCIQVFRELFKVNREGCGCC